MDLPDVSEFQPDVTWSAVAAHNGGAAIMRVLYGAEHVDRAWYAGARRADAHRSGIKVLGMYQYLVASQDAAAQAQAFVSLVGKLEPGEFAVLDLEEGAGNQLERAKQWLAHVDAKLTYPGYKGAWVYSSASFFETAGLMPIANSNRHTWVADYSAKPSVPYTLWQNSQTTTWPGIPTPCDNSVFEGDVKGLRAAVAG